MKKGIDVSEHDYGLNYTILAKQLEFVILREGYRQNRDRLFSTHLNGFKAANIPIIGVYHFVYATNATEAQKEAESCIANVKASGLTDITIWCDIEEYSLEIAEKSGIILGPEDVNQIVGAFCETITKAGFRTGIYTNENFIQNYYEPELLESYPLWYAGDTRKRECDIWQAGEFHLEGASDTLDVDYIEEEVMEMSTVEKAISWMEELARDDSHGYDQFFRWGEKGDYDCSSAVITAWKKAGVPLTCTYTGNMKQDMLRHGFVEVAGGELKRGDVLLNEIHHVAMYCGNGMEVEASVNEKGTATGGKPGDQTGREILIRSYRDYPWDCVLRYQSVEEKYMFSPETVRKGSKSESARLLQTLLKGLGYTGIDGAELAIDGDAGSHTDYALRKYQADKGLDVDGICGTNTWKTIIGI